MSFRSSPLWGGPVPDRAGPSSTLNRQIKWQSTPTTLPLPGAMTVPLVLSGQQQLIPSLTLFAELNNTVPIVIGNQQINGVTTGVMFELDPGRSATIYTDDWDKEFFDLAQFWAFHSAPLLTQFLYITVWRPVYL